MTKHGNLNQRTPQGKKQGDHPPKQTSGIIAIPKNPSTSSGTMFPTVESPLGTTQETTVNTSVGNIQHATFSTPQVVPETITDQPPPAPTRNQRRDTDTINVALEGMTSEMAPHDFVSQNYETLATLMQEEAKRRSNLSLQTRLDFDPDKEASPSRHRKGKRIRDSHQHPVFNRIGERVSDDQITDLQDREEYDTPRTRTNVHDRLGPRDLREKLRRRHSPSESPSSSESDKDRRKRRRKDSPSTSDSSDEETGHWKSRNRHSPYVDEEDDLSRPWRRQKIDAFTRRISDFSEDKRRRMPANVKTYDGTGDPDDHLKIFESAATIENWPQPVWCHMFNSTLVGNARTWFSKLPHRSIDGFEELRRAF